MVTSPNDLRALILCLKRLRGAPTRCVGLPRRLGVSRFRAVREALREATHARAYCSKHFNNLLYARRRRLHANKDAAQDKTVGLVGFGWSLSLSGF